MGWISGQEAKRQAFEHDRGATAAGQAAAYQQRYAVAITKRERTQRAAPRRLVRRD